MKQVFKIGIVAACPFPSPQGSQVFIRQLAEAMMTRGHQVHLITYHIGEELDISHLNIHRISNKIPYKKLSAGPSLLKPLLDFFLTIKLLQVVITHQINIIHAHNYESAIAGYLVKLLTGIPLIFHVHSVMEEELHTYFQHRFSKFLARNSSRFIDSIVPLLASHIITLTYEAKSFFISKGIPWDNIDYIPPGIYFPPNIQAPELRNIRHAYDIGDGPLILYTGNLDSYQNLDFLIKSFKLVTDKHPNARLVLLTHADYKDFKKAGLHSTIDGNILFIKHASSVHLQHFLAEAAVAVLPRISCTGFPIKLLNYMAAGKAIVVSESSAQCIEHLKDGFIVRDGNVVGFAEGINTLLNNTHLRQSLGNNAKKKVVTLFNWNTVAKQIEDIYNKVNLHN